MNGTETAFGVYVHVPFCVARCGYCDFTTYTSAEIAGGQARTDYCRWVRTEIAFARRELERLGTGGRAVETVFFGGGTPTLLQVPELIGILDAIRASWELAPDAEITVEANPDSVSPHRVGELAAGGMTRLSLGMQSAVPEVLATLNRTHAPEQVQRAVDAGHSAGMEVSLDLIYGAPGETLAQWEASLNTAVEYGIGHLSVYALTLEPHTPLARRISRGEVAPLNLDEQAEKYELADGLLAAAGLNWYEISNFARTP
ncbi:MAG: radical SAM protein, partial [Bifidobacteriaceae bacterium]|nr:radical SAM protein [Bifidobacteriaceae bacterium]